jgi:hypothetical protein
MRGERKMVLDYVSHINQGTAIQGNWKDHVERKNYMIADDESTW